MSINFVLDGMDLTVSAQEAATFASGSPPSLSGDANATMQMAASSFDGIFWFAGDSIDLNDTANVDLSFAAVPSAWPTIVVSGATVDQADRVQNNIGDQNIKSDYVRHMAKSIFGSNAILADVFSNELALVADIATLDTLDSDGIKAKAAVALNEANAGSGTNPKNSGDTGASNITKSLLDQILRADAGSRLTDSDLLATSNKGSGDLADYYNLKFKAGDTLKMKVTYNPQAQTPLTGAGTINARSYTVVITLTA